MKIPEKEQQNIQWYPGHMTKARRMMEENISQVDAVCELLDARIPSASSNPDIAALVGDRPRIVVLNRADLADGAVTKKWEEYYRKQGCNVLVADSKSGRGTAAFLPLVRQVLADRIAAFEKKGQVGRTMKIMVLGIPNVGKSTFINTVAGRHVAQSADRPGVTRGKQWIRLGQGVDLLDTPGILWPKFESQEVGELLALTNAIRTEVFDAELLASNFMLHLRQMYPEALENRYHVTAGPEDDGYSLLEKAARKRGMLISGGEADTERMAITLLKEYHEGKLGKLSLEEPDGQDCLRS